MNIVILHGWGHRGDLWRSLAFKLGAKAQVFDLPGFGLEPIVAPDWGVPEYADWVQNKTKKYKKVLLIGHSFGGRVSAEIAARRPHNLKAIILSDAPCLYRPSKKIQIRIALYKAIKSFLPEYLKSFFYPSDLKNSRQMGLEQTFRKVVNYDQTQQLKRIDVPTLLVWGENDNQVPIRIAKEMNDIIPNSELKIIDQVGHNPYLEKPDLFFGYVNNFISSLT